MPWGPFIIPPPPPPPPPLPPPHTHTCAHTHNTHPAPTPTHAHAQGNHIFTSGATGTNAAVIRGALRAEKPELLTVVLPQSMEKQPQESQELLQQASDEAAPPLQP